LEDDGVGDRVDANLYLNLAEAYKDGDEKNITKWLAEIEKKEGHKINDENSLLYSQKKGKIISFADKVLELNEAYEDLMFDLADNSNESMRELKTYRAGEIIRFNKRVVEKVRRKNKINQA
jgi:hypothetical protein